MPYIDKERRKLFDPHVDEMFRNVITLEWWDERPLRG